jgi:arylsulfatase A-like enzyme
MVVMVVVDILPTLCEILEIPLPENKLDGKSFLPVIESKEANSSHEVMHWMWQEMWAVKKGNWKLIYEGHDTTGKFSNHPEKEFNMPKYYLANLNDEKPEEINHADKFPQIVQELIVLHEIWAQDVFEGSGYKDPNKFEVIEIKKGKGTTKL